MSPAPNTSSLKIGPPTYAYDTLNRISLFEEKATNTAPACAAGGSTPCRAYGYDNWSNQFVTQANVVTRHSFTPAAASNFDAANRLIIQSSAYDPAGNQTAIGGYTFTYDAENRLKTSAIGGNATTYVYDGEGRRVKKGNEIYVYDAFGNLAAEYGGTPLAEGGPRYLTTDHLGSTRLITKADGAVDQRIDYLPFGKAIPTGVSSRATGQGYQTNNYLDPLKPGFTGKDRDAETGLDYFGARYLAAAQGRFASADAPFADQFPENPQSWNLYSYVRNRPLLYVDPTGEAVELVGDEEERTRLLNGLIRAVGPRAGAYLYQNRVETKNRDGSVSTRYFVGVLAGGQSGKGPDFGSINEASMNLAAVIADKQIGQVALVNAFAPFVYFSPTGAQTRLDSEYVGLTSPFNEPSPIKVWVLNPDSAPYLSVPEKMAGNYPGVRDLSTVMMHELGHMMWQMDKKAGRPTNPDPYGNRRALDYENSVRQRRGMGTRRVH